MKKDILTGLPLGIAIGITLSMIICGIMNSTNEIARSILQMLVTPVITLVAAAMALRGISKQIQNNVDASEKVRIAKLDAAKSVLPIVLSNICQICTERCFAIACGKKEKAANWRWEMTDTELSTLKECIEFSIGVEKGLMLQICRIYQILIARWDNLDLEDLFSSESLDTSSGLDPAEIIPAIQKPYKQFHAIENWMVLNAISASLFDYSRGKESNPDNDGIIDLALLELSKINSGMMTEEHGQYLTSKAKYADFINELNENRQLEFTNED